MEIIPAIDLRGGKCVRLRQGDYARETVFSDNPVEVAQRFRQEGATRLHLVDLDGAKAGRPVNTHTVRQIVESVDIACQLGGGIRDQASIELALSSLGVDRVIVGTQALKQPDWFRSMAARYPRQLVLGLDARNSLVATEGWLDVSQTRAIELARRYAGLPLAAIVYTNIANDGMLAGVDAATLADLVELASLGISVIASGGVTSTRDIANLVRAAQDSPQLTGAIIGRALYEGTLTLPAALRTAATGEA
jgi:phosphoribosylformimino-5-aminoimidazole carboxamide ribotide isomerase